MLAALTGLASGGVSTSVSSKSGDASSPFDAAFQYNAGFQVGGSGTQTQSTDSKQDKSSAGTGASGYASPAANLPIYISLAVVGLIALAAVIGARSSK